MSLAPLTHRTQKGRLLSSWPFFTTILQRIALVGLSLFRLLHKVRTSLHVSQTSADTNKLRSHSEALQFEGKETYSHRSYYFQARSHAGVILLTLFTCSTWVRSLSTVILTPSKQLSGVGEGGLCYQVWWPKLYPKVPSWLKEKTNSVKLS